MLEDKKKNKVPTAQDQVGGKVNAGIMDAVAGMCEQTSDNIEITLYHGVNRKNLEYNLEHGGFLKRVCAEGGPSAIWLSEKQYRYEFTFQLTFPKSLLGDKLLQETNVDYIYTDDISFDEFECKLIKTNIDVFVDDSTIVNVNLLDNELLNRQLKIFPDLCEKISNDFEKYSMISEHILSSFLPEQKIAEGAEPESDTYKIGFEGNSNNEYAHAINESTCKDEMKEYINSLLNYMKDEGLNIYPFPKIKMDDSEQEGLFIRTGYYEPATKTVVVFTRDRHVKDCMRSLAHELIHHEQNLDGKDLSFSSNDDVKDNQRLEEIESEAYLKGNIYFRKWTEHQQHDKKQSLNESIEPSKIDLSSFNIKRNLNPKFWKDDRLDSRVRMKLLDLADDFIEFLGVDWVKPDDIIMTGSLANFNWHQKYSDIDLHILMDYSKVDKRRDFVANYFYSQKKLWNDEHKDIKIYGFPVEVYVQDTNEESLSSGVYSLEKDKWIEEPERGALAGSKVNKTFIRDTVAKYANKIDNLYDKFKDAKSDDYKLEKISEEADKIFNEIISLRKKSLKKSETEISNGNIIFKCLRRFGFIEKILKIKSISYDKINSIP